MQVLKKEIKDPSLITQLGVIGGGAAKMGHDIKNFFTNSEQENQEEKTLVEGMKDVLRDSGVSDIDNLNVAEAKELYFDTIYKSDEEGFMNPSEIEKEFFGPENSLMNGVIDDKQYKKIKELEVDFDFIGKSEGKGIMEGYVPTNNGEVLDSSGVTIGTGVDLGQKNIEYFEGFEHEDILNKIKPYFGMKGQEALTYEEETPLNLLSQEVGYLDEFTKNKEMSLIEKSFKDLTGKEFANMPPELQTIISDLQFQYGTDYNKTPKFRDIIKSIAKDPENKSLYSDLENELRNFGDKYQTRRGREADLIKGMNKGY